MRWIVLFSIIFVISSAMLWQMTPDGAALWFCLYTFAIAFIAAEFALIFVNAQLPSLGGEEAIGKIMGHCARSSHDQPTDGSQNGRKGHRGDDRKQQGRRGSPNRPQRDLRY